MEFSKKLYELRKEKSFSQEELADKLNVARQTISKWENGTTTPDTNNLIELSKIFEISIDELLCNNCKKESDKEKKKTSKTKKIIIMIIALIIIICVIMFLIKIINRYNIVDKFTDYYMKENHKDEYFYFESETEMKNATVDKWNFINIKVRDNILIKEYYETRIDKLKNQQSPDLIRIEIYDDTFYYDIDMINKTYTKKIDEVGKEQYYNNSGLIVDGEFFKEFGELLFFKDKLKIAFDFNYKLKESSGNNSKSYSITKKENENEVTGSVYFSDNSFGLNVTRINSTAGVIDLKVKDYNIDYREINDDEIKILDLTEFTLVE